MSAMDVVHACHYKLTSRAGGFEVSRILYQDIPYPDQAQEIVKPESVAEVVHCDRD